MVNFFTRIGRTVVKRVALVNDTVGRVFKSAPTTACSC
jgi:hypothetical protein